MDIIKVCVVVGFSFRVGTALVDYFLNAMEEVYAKIKFLRVEQKIAKASTDFYKGKVIVGKVNIGQDSCVPQGVPMNQS